MIPIAVASFYLAISYGRQIGAMAAVSWSLLVALVHAEPIKEFAVLAGGATVGVLLLDSIRSRSKQSSSESSRAWLPPASKSAWDSSSTVRWRSCCPMPPDSSPVD